MDRREALKKLGVGGAVAVSAPVILDAFNVAHACSAASATAAVPSPPLVSGNNIVITFAIAAFNCAGTPTFNWRVRSATPAIVLTVNAVGNEGTVKKGPGNSPNPANFVIDVDVLNGAALVATYELVGAPNQLVQVTKIA